MKVSSSQASEADKRLEHLLNTAMDVFMRHGYRKTSMNDVAAAADISRQGLYLHFSSKEELFKASMAHAITWMRQYVDDTLAKTELPLDERLYLIFDTIMGRHVGLLTADSFDLAAATEDLTGELIESALHDLQIVLGRCIDEATLTDRSIIEDITGKDRAATLLNVAIGLKHASDTREEFRQRLRLSLRVILAPLRLRGKA